MVIKENYWTIPKLHVIKLDDSVKEVMTFTSCHKKGLKYLLLREGEDGYVRNIIKRNKT